MKGVSRRSLLLFVVGKTLTPKAVVSDIVVTAITKAVVGPELSLLIHIRKRLRYVKSY